jgi:hypothetical protein
LDFGVELVEMEVGWNLAMLNSQRRLKHTGNSRSAFGMPYDCLNAANHELAVFSVWEENTLDRPGLDS